MNEVITHILKSGEIIFEDIEIEEYENTSRVILHLKPSPEVANQCPICGCNCEYYDTPRLGNHIKNGVHWIGEIKLSLSNVERIEYTVLNMELLLHVYHGHIMIAVSRRNLINRLHGWQHR